jgi:hypothetical protein
MSYEKRIVAFGDILGWKEATRTRASWAPYQKNPWDMLNWITSYASKFSEENKGVIAQVIHVENNKDKDPNLVWKEVKEMEEIEDVEFSYFSDSFIVSAPAGKDDFLIFKILSVICDALLSGGGLLAPRNKPKVKRCRPFLVRGGVTIGNLRHHEGIAYGPALIEATEIEKNAYYPRFLCSNNLIKYLDAVPTSKEKVVFEDDYGQWAVNTAEGSSSHHLPDLMSIIEEEIKRLGTGKNAYKWRYVQKMLPKMFCLKGI